MKELIWLPDEPGKYTFEEALKLQNEEKRLPTIGELRLAFENGIKFADRFYWSSSVHPDYSYNAYYFGGRDGDFYLDLRDFYDHVSVRLVKREK